MIADVPEVFAQEFGLSHAEFFRTLPSAINGQPYRVEGDTVVIDDANGRVTIRLGPEQRRNIALLSIPYTEIRFAFDGFTTGQRSRFMDRFNLYFRRGGG